MAKASKCSYRGRDKGPKGDNWLGTPGTVASPGDGQCTSTFVSQHSLKNARVPLAWEEPHWATTAFWLCRSLACWNDKAYRHWTRPSNLLLWWTHTCLSGSLPPGGCPWPRTEGRRLGNSSGLWPGGMVRGGCQTLSLGYPSALRSAVGCGSASHPQRPRKGWSRGLHRHSSCLSWPPAQIPGFPAGAFWICLGILGQGQPVTGNDSNTVVNNTTTHNLCSFSNWKTDHWFPY